jgi:hypothetical protein
MYNITLTKLCSNHNHVRSPIIEGECVFLPIKGRIFTMVATPLDKTKAVRYIHTTVIQEIINDGTTYMFHTRNSTYRLDISR